jgi:glyoxylase-like metal-dependent hydrolase (beta-lactamase superfamily II)
MSSLDDHDVAHLRADNPGPFTLTGTNTWLVGRDPCWIVDPGPALDDHVAGVLAEAGRRGGAGGIALTHRHRDHDESADEVARSLGAPVAASTGRADVRLADGDGFGPLRTIATPGHTAEHVAFVAGRVAFTGDAVLGEGSVYVAGWLAAYLDSLRRLRAMDLALALPGHGPVIEDPSAKLDEYVEHRLDRERRLVAALDAGARTVDEMLDAAWDDAPQVLRPAAAVTLAAHLGKLDEEGRLPAGVERPEVPDWLQV